MVTGSGVNLETISALAAEHVAVRSVLDQTASALTAGETGRAAERLLAGHELLTTGLDEHFRVEDEELFPAVADELGAGLVGVFSEEHVRIRTLRDEVYASLAGSSLATAACEELCDLLGSHSAREDELLFPAARDVLAGDAASSR